MSQINSPQTTTATPKDVIVMKEVKPITFFGYILEKTIGAGAYAKVKEGRSIKEDMSVAVKIINREKAGEDVIEKFTKREIEIMRSLDHPNVVTTYEVVMNEKFIFIVMDLAECGDLLDFVIARQYLNEEMAQHFFNDLISGMQYIHTNGFAHRDLKCENLLIHKNFNLKISDFGFSTQISHKRCDTYCGSLAYAAPEVIDGKPYIATFSDIWSMGVVLYAMVIGKLPFTENELTAKQGPERILNLNFPHMISDECVSILHSILDSCPAQRIQLNKMQEHKWMIRKKSSNAIKEELRYESEESNSNTSESYQTAINSQPSSKCRIKTNGEVPDIKSVPKQQDKGRNSRTNTPEPRSGKNQEIKRRQSKQRDSPIKKKGEIENGKIKLTDKMLENLNKLKQRNRSV
ncbi:Testis-specific serine/threonine-protein kinase 1-like [Oopsacas minuta]|uniref:non-specific serine/threonine protein kinase n=1 Tax=Oopsacas minuta TaxID=111878 RepID=A0AAV7KKG4_9METZ|nr:Testis-specific serine/threonine-protein kinase 1-like [Oopsacas minuta]